ncbi:hypothetical protein HDV62DRAFT_20120 [Trichoderma sp. SZMC 28011]
MQVGTRTRTGSTAAGDVRGAGQQGAIHRNGLFFSACVECTSYFVRGVFVKARTQSFVCPSSNISTASSTYMHSQLASRGRETFGVRVHAWASLISCGTPHLPIQPTANGTPCYRRNWLYHRVPSPSPRSASGENMGTVGC